jgi:DNA-binding NarL/FixJ family response regulator
VIRILLVADSGAVMASITATLADLPRVDIVGYASGRAPLAAVMASIGPDVVLIDEMRRRGLAAERIAEARRAHPSAAIVALAERPESLWVAEALRAGATAVVPRELAPATLDLVLTEVLAAPHPQHDENAYPSIERSAA